MVNKAALEAKPPPLTNSTQAPYGLGPRHSIATRLMNKIPERAGLGAHPELEARDANNVRVRGGGGRGRPDPWIVTLPVPAPTI